MGFTDLGPPRGGRPPLTRRRAVAIVVVYGVLIGFVVALFSGVVPGLGGHITSDVTLNGHQYYPDYYYLPNPAFGNNTTSPLSVQFHNVTFWVWVSNWGGPYGALVHGNGTEANGTSYAFVLGGFEPNKVGTELFVSPDAQFAATWGGGNFLILLVEVEPGDASAGIVA